MPIYQNKSKDDIPRFEKSPDEIIAEVKPGGALQVLSPLEYHTDQQRKWIKGVACYQLSYDTGYTPDECDLLLKAMCGGEDLLKKEKVWIGKNNFVERLTIKGVGKRNLKQYIENIISTSITKGWGITPPDPELRKG